VDLENLITDSNRSIATLAITTLLKTGAESSIDRLMKQIGTFVSEISDEFKVVVVQAIKSLCLKFPRKHGTLMQFLSALLRDEGGLDYKAAIADTIITIIEENPEAKETGEWESFTVHRMDIPTVDAYTLPIPISSLIFNSS
jgi:coatomer protein complex subunit gamma